MQLRVRATFMRGGTSKGVFFSADDLPANFGNDPSLRDRFLMRVIGSPDPYSKQIDGMGGATSSTSKVVLVSKSVRDDCDVDFLFGAVDIERPVIDWSGNCGNLTTAVGPFAIAREMIEVPSDGIAKVRIWQANIQKRIIAHVPIHNGAVVELGDFELDGVPFPAAQIRLDFLDPGGSGDGQTEKIFPTGRIVETLSVPGVGDVEVTLINAGNPTVFVRAQSFGLKGTELQPAVNSDLALLQKLEAVRAHAAVAMGLAKSVEDATEFRPATPKIAMIAGPQRYVASNGRLIEADQNDLVVRILSMGKLHHAVTGTGAVAVAAAAAITGTLVHQVVGAARARYPRIGHPSGTFEVGSEVSVAGTPSEWIVNQVSLSRTARQLMDGWILVPELSAR